MALRELLAAANTLLVARARISELNAERQKLLDRLVVVNADLVTARADAGAAVITVHAESITVAIP